MRVLCKVVFQEVVQVVVQRVSCGGVDYLVLRAVYGALIVVVWGFFRFCAVVANGCWDFFRLCDFLYLFVDA